MMGKAEFDAMVEAARVAARQREELAATLAAAGKPLRLRGDDDRYATASPDLEAAGKYRLTRFDRLGPIGHTQYNSLEQAILEGLREKYLPAT